MSFFKSLTNAGDAHKDPATLASPFIQARHYADGRSVFLAWTCHPSQLLDDRAVNFPQIIDSTGECLTPPIGNNEDLDSMPSYSSQVEAEEAIRKFSESKARHSVIQEDLISAEITYLEQRIQTLKSMQDS